MFFLKFKLHMFVNLIHILNKVLCILSFKVGLVYNQHLNDYN